MTDRVFVKNLRIHGHHGVLAEETRLGQHFFVDMTCTTDHHACAATDDYAKAVCYASLCQLAADVSDSGPFRLIETLAERIADRILKQFPTVAEVTVEVRKPAAPIAAVFDHVGVAVTRTRAVEIAFSFGSNKGDKAANIRHAIDLIRQNSRITLHKTSRLYRTAPWGDTDQDWFLNACATATTSLDPAALLSFVKAQELRIGRTPTRHWGPREIDIDILYYGEQTLDTPDLTLPHRELFNRAFVLVPLAEIAGDHTVQGRRIDDCAGACDLSSGNVAPYEAPSAAR